MVVRNELEKHLLHKSPSLLRKISECRDQLLEDIFDHDSDNKGSSLLNSRQNITKAESKRAEDLLNDLKYINETECPVLENIEVPKVNS